ncbi:uncharacterized protein METZ01_LOCUS131672 [marine metagenome]|uniref:Uncharacterized protein n=1 Tax=marine metagenome TaxID=408172 RepID=A0A381YP60_9ZZZZ
MRFEELKKYKGGKVVKPRDPNWKQMQDIKKSGAAGSHGDKTKIIPRKAKHQDDLTEADVKYLTELAFLPLLIPALGAAVRLGAPHVLRFLGRKGAKDILKKGAGAGASVAKKVAQGAKPLIKQGGKGAGSVVKGVGKQVLKHPIKATILGVGAKIYMEVDELIDDITELVGDMLDSETIKALAQVAIKWALPATAIIAILYGGKKLYDYVSDDEPEAQPQEDIQDESDEYHPARLLGVAQAHLGYGLEMAQHVLNKDEYKAESMARVIVDGWPDAINKIQNVYKRTGNGSESIKEFIDDRVGTVVKTSQGKRVKIIQADPKQGLYKVEFQSGVEVYMSRDDLNLEVPTDALGKETKPRDWKHPWDIGEDKEKPTDKEIKQAKGIAFDKRYKDGNYTGASNTIEKLKKGLSKHPDVANALKRANEDLDSPAHKAQSSIWHKSNPIGRNFMDPDDYDSDARGTHIIMDNPTELHFYKVPAKDYDEAFDKWLDGKNSDRVQDHEFYDSTKDYASDHQYWGRIAPENDTMNWPDDDPDREDDDDWSDKDEKEFGTAKKPDDQEEPKKEGSQSSIPKGNIGDLVRVRKEDDEHDGRLGRIVDFFSDDEGQYYTLAFDDEVDTTEYGAGENNYEIGELEFLDQTVDRRDEGGMPSSVIRHKQKLSDMTDKELADRFKDFDEETLRQMAWRHGYGKMDSHYWDRVQAGKQEEAIIKDARTKILEKFGVTDLEDYKEKMKTLYGLERYMKKDPELADEIKRRYIELRQWKKDYDASNEGNYEQQLYDGIKETATAGATSAGSIATVVSPDLAYHNPKKKGKHGAPKAPQKKKGDGTAVNALDMGNNLMGGTPMKR